jgi:hypothetical protein
VERISGTPKYRRLLAFAANIRLGWKVLPRTKVYIVWPLVSDKEKSFIALIIGVSVVINIFVNVKDSQQTRMFFFIKPFQPILFVSKVGAYLSGALLRCSTLR